MTTEDPNVYEFTGPYRFLSNFWSVVVTLPDDDLDYPTLEHAYQAAKSLNLAVRQNIQRATTPGKAKGLGRHVTLRPRWDVLRLDIMKDLVRQKFTCDETLRISLLATGDAELIEGNSWGDVFWGKCNGVGQNHLGKILMEVRQELRNLQNGART